MDKEKQISEAEKTILPEESAVSEKSAPKKRKTRTAALGVLLKKKTARRLAIKDQPATPSDPTFQALAEEILPEIEALQETEKKSPVVNEFDNKYANFFQENKKEENLEKINSVFNIPDENENDKGKKVLKISLIVLGMVAVLGLAGTAGYFYYKYKTLSRTNPSAKESQAYIEKISKFILLPDEEPTLATVADVEKLKEQPFFAEAQNGDKVLLFMQAKKAFLYRPSENKLIEMMALGESQTSSLQNTQENQNLVVPIPVEEQPAESASQPAAEIAEIPEKQKENAKVAVYNGANIKGLAQKIGDKLALISGVIVSEKTNAEGSYQKTLVIDLSGSQTELAQKIAAELGGEIGQLPEGETKPAADILVIVAKE
jgi:hypothetical protein